MERNEDQNVHRRFHQLAFDHNDFFHRPHNDVVVLHWFAMREDGEEVVHYDGALFDAVARFVLNELEESGDNDVRSDFDVSSEREEGGEYGKCFLVAFVID